MAAEQARNFGLDSLCQKRSRAVAQNLGQRIGKSSWLRELENISLSHGVSLLRWRSGGLEHPHDTPPYPFTPSPTFAYSSPASIIEDIIRGIETAQIVIAEITPTNENVFYEVGYAHALKKPTILLVDSPYAQRSAQTGSPPRCA